MPGQPPGRPACWFRQGESPPAATNSTAWELQAKRASGGLGRSQRSGRLEGWELARNGRRAGAGRNCNPAWLCTCTGAAAARSAHRLGAAAPPPTAWPPAHAANLKPARRSFFHQSTLTTSHQHPTSELWLLRQRRTTWARQGRHTGTTDLALLPRWRRRGPAPLLRCSHPSASQAVLCSPLLPGPRQTSSWRAGRAALPCEDLREWELRRLRGQSPTAEIRQHPRLECLEPWLPRRRSVPRWTALPAGDRLALAPGAGFPPTGWRLFAHGHIPAGPWGVAGWAWGRRRRPAVAGPPVTGPACSVTKGGEQTGDPALEMPPPCQLEPMEPGRSLGRELIAYGSGVSPQPRSTSACCFCCCSVPTRCGGEDCFVLVGW